MTWRIALLGPLVFAGWLALADATPAAESPPSPDAATQALPSTDQMIQRMEDRSAALARVTNAPAWSYDKKQVMTTLDGDGKVEAQTESLYRVQIIHGVPFSRLIKIAGRDLTKEKLEKENKRQADFEKGLSGRDPKKAVADGEALITTNMMDRFQFQVLRREAILGRPAIAVSFAAKPGKSDHSLEDHLLNRMAGTFWVDEETADVVKIELHLTKALSIGIFGMVASIKDMKMDMLSWSMTDGTWLPEKTEMSISARMLLMSTHFKMEETSSNFTLEPVLQTAVP